MKTRTEWFVHPVRGPWWNARARRWVTTAEMEAIGGASCARVRTYAAALRLARAAQAVEDCAYAVRTMRSGRAVETHGWLWGR